LVQNTAGPEIRSNKFNVIYATGEMEKKESTGAKQVFNTISMYLTDENAI